MTSFSENELQPDGSRPPVWFAFDETRPLAFLAGINVRDGKSVRKVKEGEVMAMSVILRTQEEVDQWMAAPAEEALKMQKPLPDGVLKVVARGSKKDGD